MRCFCDRKQRIYSPLQFSLLLCLSSIKCNEAHFFVSFIAFETRPVVTILFSHLAKNFQLCYTELLFTDFSLYFIINVNERQLNTEYSSVVVSYLNFNQLLTFILDMQNELYFKMTHNVKNFFKIYV